MNIIKNVHDLRILKSDKSVKKSILNWVEAKIRILYQNFSRGETFEVFNFKDITSLIIIEEEDSINDLAALGLGDEKIINMKPEWIDQTEIFGDEIYILCFVLSYQFSINLYVDPNNISSEISDWLNRIK